MCTAFRLLVGACVLVAAAQCYPDGSRASAGGPEDFGKPGTVLVLPNLDFGDGLDYTDEGQLSSGFYNPLSGFVSSMQSMMDRFRQQMTDVLSRIPDQGNVFSWGSIPDGANTTSTTKVIDGHIVTINETTYTSGDNETGAVFRVRIVDVKPQDETNESPNVEEGPEPTTISPAGKENTTPGRSVETVEDLRDNEIPDTNVEVLSA